ALSRFDTASDKLEPILTEKYIASFGYGIDIYNDYRRTGYPKINDPQTDNDPQTIRSGPFPIRLPYYNSELATNPNAPKVQPNIATEKIFWDIN
ncbi:MAG: SusD/RagB family nutrient-binding outer membrane lipoprotein, partial [Bacteroidota bacterium]|nr:SusD/RagB family nutrient-binding outer membrane lipoprotein [Bacteroidota bacterium]